MQLKKIIYLPIILALVVEHFFIYQFFVHQDGKIEPTTLAKPQELLSFVATFEKGEKINFIPCDTLRFEGITSAYMAPEYLYGPTFINESLAVLRGLKKTEVSFLVFSPHTVLDADIVFCVESGSEKLIYASKKITQNLEKGKWNKVEVSLDIDPTILQDKQPLKLGVYLFNGNKQKLFLDNYSVKLLGNL